MELNLKNPEVQYLLRLTKREVVERAMLLEFENDKRLASAAKRAHDAEKALAGVRATKISLLQSRIQELEADADYAREEAEKAENHLSIFGQHMPHCNTYGQSGLTCTCGLEA